MNLPYIHLYEPPLAERAVDDEAGRDIDPFEPFNINVYMVTLWTNQQ